MSRHVNMANTKAQRTQSPIRALRNEARNSFKKIVGEAEQRGYERGIKAALAITRGKRG